MQNLHPFQLIHNTNTLYLLGMSFTHPLFLNVCFNHQVFNSFLNVGWIHTRGSVEAYDWQAQWQGSHNLLSPKKANCTSHCNETKAKPEAQLHVVRVPLGLLLVQFTRPDSLVRRFSCICWLLCRAKGTGGHYKKI